MACLPARWRAFLSDRSESLLLGLEDQHIVLWRERGEDLSEYARIARDAAPEEQSAEFRRLRGALEDPATRCIFCIPAGQVLTRMLSLPAAAEDNLRQVLGFEMDRQTPFKADQVYFDSRVLGHDAGGRNAHVELSLIPRERLDQELEALPPAARELDAVDSWRDAPGEARRHVNLLPAERRVHRRNLRTPLNAGLAALVVLLLIFNMNESLANREAALSAMRDGVEQANVEARQVAALRKSLADSVAGANFLADRKRQAPLTVALIDDVSRRLPHDAYLERLQVQGSEVQLQGQADEAAKLIALLGASPCLGNPGFQGQVQPDPRSGKERFQITAELKECHPQGGAVEGAPSAEGGTAGSVAPSTAAAADAARAGSAVGPKAEQTSAPKSRAAAAPPAAAVEQPSATAAPPKAQEKGAGKAGAAREAQKPASPRMPSAKPPGAQPPGKSVPDSATKPKSLSQRGSAEGERAHAAV